MREVEDDEAERTWGSDVEVEEGEEDRWREGVDVGVAAASFKVEGVGVEVEAGRGVATVVGVEIFVGVGVGVGVDVEVGGVELLELGVGSVLAWKSPVPSGMREKVLFFEVEEYEKISIWMPALSKRTTESSLESLSHPLGCSKTRNE